MSDFDFDEIDEAVNGALGTEASATYEEHVPSTPLGDDASNQHVQFAPAVKRGTSGRFMDMVHPSSDMRRETSATPPSLSTNAGNSRIPEPPVFYKDSATTSTRVEPEVPSQAQNNEWAAALESPFLSDAKVEKRPLGGPGGDATVPANTLFAEPKEILLEAPEEELLLEATTLPDPIDFSQSVKSETPEVLEVPSPDLEEQLVGPTSITQQYTEQPGAAQESGAIYDTESYHQPLVTPAKKRSGAWVFLWIFLLVLIGAAVGAALYFYVLPRI